MLKKLFKALIDTLKDPDLLSSQPHHGEEHERDPEWDSSGSDEPDEREYCWITNKPLTTYPMYFSHEFDCWISQEGYDIIMKHKCEPDSPCEWGIIKDEFINNDKLEILV